jgi:glycosyltransferase involved in cell wall biosynthesis
MRVIQICPSYKPAYTYGGPTVSVSMLCEQMQKSSLKQVVLTTTANGGNELEVQCNTLTNVDTVPVRYFKRITKDHSHFSPSLCLHLFQEIRKGNKAAENMIIHIHSWWNLVSILTCLVARLAKLVVVISPRGMLTDYSFGHKNKLVKRWIHTFLGKWLLNGCHLHATSDREKGDILSFLQPKSIIVIPNILSLPVITTFDDHEGVQTVDSSKISSSPTPALKLLFFSRIDEKKGIELLVTAVARLQIEYHLTIAGTGAVSYITQLKTLATSLGISKNVTWLGQVDNQQKYQELIKHDLLVLPSYNENFANVVIESLAVGTAVLISDQVGLADYVLKSKLGWVSKLNPIPLAAHISMIANSKAKLTAIRTTAPERIATDFSSIKIAKEYLAFYKNLFPTA